MTLTDIANIAIVGLGQKAINNIDGDETNARKTKLFLNTVIEEVSAYHPWTKLKRTVQLARTPTVRDDGRSEFLLPKNLLKIVESYPDCDAKREGNVIVAVGETLSIKCTIISYNPDDWGVNLRSAIVAKLKATLAPIILSDANMAQLFIQSAQVDLNRAMSEDIYSQRAKRPRGRCEFVDFDSYL